MSVKNYFLKKLLYKVTTFFKNDLDMQIKIEI